MLKLSIVLALAATAFGQALCPGSNSAPDKNGILRELQQIGKLIPSGKLWREAQPGRSGVARSLPVPVSFGREAPEADLRRSAGHYSAFGHRADDGDRIGSST